ncbi:MAG: CRISPR-associated DxTHG motif protein [Oxalobacteraceae bacterium]|nr:MAG: CRISPR-associated DxTHG motif protein [Oxalobacteraceae bacterium]
MLSPSALSQEATTHSMRFMPLCFQTAAVIPAVISPLGSCTNATLPCP